MADKIIAFFENQQSSFTNRIQGSGPNNIDKALENYQHGASVEDVYDENGELLGFKVGHDAKGGDVIPGRELYKIGESPV